MRRSEISEWCVFLKMTSNLEQCILCLLPLPRLAKLLWCGASRRWEFEKRLFFLIFLCSLYWHNLQDGPLVCASVSIWNMCFISFVYLWFTTIFVNVWLVYSSLSLLMPCSFSSIDSLTPWWWSPANMWCGISLLLFPYHHHQICFRGWQWACLS